MSSHKPSESIDRRTLLRRGAVAGGALALPGLLAACGGGSGGGTSSATAANPGGGLKGTGQVVMGTFPDPTLDPFKAVMIPLFEKETGIEIVFLEDEYGVALEKFFADAVNGAGQYDLYFLDDPWVPQFGAAEVLEDLGAAGVEGDENPDVIPVLASLGYWPPKQGPRLKAFEAATPTLVGMPFYGDVQILTYRTDVFPQRPATWDAYVAGAKKGIAAGLVKYGYAFRGVSGNPVTTTWYPICYCFGSKIFADDWRPAFNGSQGKASADFLIDTLGGMAPAGSVQYDVDQEAAAILNGEAAGAVEYSPLPIAAVDPSSKLRDKLGYGPNPRQVASVGQVGVYVNAIPRGAPNKENAVTFLKWWQQPQIQLQWAREGRTSFLKSPYADPRVKRRHPVGETILEQLETGASVRPRTPDWAKVESLIGTQLSAAVERGSGGGEALDVAAEQVEAYLSQQGYY